MVRGGGGVSFGGMFYEDRYCFIIYSIYITLKILMWYCVWEIRGGSRSGCIFFVTIF